MQELLFLRFAHRSMLTGIQTKICEAILNRLQVIKRTRFCD